MYVTLIILSIRAFDAISFLWRLIWMTPIVVPPVSELLTLNFAPFYWLEIPLCFLFRKLVLLLALKDDRIRDVVRRRVTSWSHWTVRSRLGPAQREYHPLAPPLKDLPHFNVQRLFLHAKDYKYVFCLNLAAPSFDEHFCLS